MNLIDSNAAGESTAGFKRPKELVVVMLNNFDEPSKNFGIGARRDRLGQELYE